MDMKRLIKSVFLLMASASLVAANGTDEMNALLKDGKDQAAFELAEKLSNAKDPEGDQALGFFYENGRVVSQDDTRAVAHYRACAMAGLKHCQWRLGVKLDLGEGVAANPEEAFSWLQKSAAQSYANAYVSMGVMYAMGRGTPQDFAKSMEYYRTGAKLGNSHGFFGIGILHARGEGVEKDMVSALAWFIVAHFQGDPQAERPMNGIMSSLSETEVKAAVEKANALQDEFGLRKTEKTSAS
jgi:TPR repeat protein